MARNRTKPRTEDARKFEAVVKRLRECADDEAADVREDGHIFGIEWAEHKATPRQLKRLAAARDRRELCFRDEDALAVLARMIDADVDLSEFWDHVCDDCVEQYQDAAAAFAEGFVEGAMDVWDAVERHL